MSSFPPLDCARVKLALALIKTCRHLEWGPQKPVTPPTSLSQADQPSPMHSFHGGEGGTSPSHLGTRGRGALTGQTFRLGRSSLVSNLNASGGDKGAI